MTDLDKEYRENANLVYRYLFSLSHDQDMAEELTQQTFCEAVSSAGKYRGDAEFSTYLCGIAKNLLKKELARRKKHEHLSLDDAAETVSGSDTQAEALGKAARGELFRRIHALPEKTREVVYLRLAGELSFTEIGAILEKSETWARVTFYRAKQKLMEGDAEEC